MQKPSPDSLDIDKEIAERSFSKAKFLAPMEKVLKSKNNWLFFHLRAENYFFSELFSYHLLLNYSDENTLLHDLESFEKAFENQSSQ